MKYRDFGSTGIKVSEVGFGAWAIGGNEHGNSYGFTDDKISLEALQTALDAGCNFFDSADVYGWGHSEELLGKAFKGKRDRVVLATKVGGDFYQGAGFQTFTAEYIRFALDKSLERLKTDYVDVYQLHNPPLKLINKEETYSVLNDLKREGKVRAWGVSVFDPVEGLSALKVGRPDCLQVCYNLFNPRPAEKLFPEANRNGCAIIAREPLANGFLAGKLNGHSKFADGDIRAQWPGEYIEARLRASEKLRKVFAASQRTLAQTAILYALAQTSVTVVIPGIKSAAQCIENLAASDLLPLSESELSEVAVLQRTNFV